MSKFYERLWKRRGSIRMRINIDRFRTRILNPNTGLDITIKARNKDDVVVALEELLKEYKEDIKENKLPDNIRNMLQIWIDNNDNPIRELSFLRLTYSGTGNVDEDGFCNYTVFGYVEDGYKNLESLSIDFRLKEPLGFAFDKERDYTLEELGLRSKK